MPAYVLKCEGCARFGSFLIHEGELPEARKKINVPVLVMHGDDDQIVPYADSAPLSAKLLRNSMTAGT
jgi:non-heme chloroperoxidase